MNKVLKWVLIGLGITVAAFLVAMTIFRGSFFGGGHMRDFGGFNPMMMIPLGGLLFFRFLVPAGVLTLAVIGVVLLVRDSKAKKVQAVQPEPQLPARHCVKCTKPLQEDWVNCPYCGKKQ